MRLNFLILFFIFFFLNLNGEVKWWDKRWNRRCKIVFHSSGYIENFPVIIKGSQIKKILNEDIPVSTIRIIGKEGEIPLQIDEYDNLILPPSSPNRILDENDEIVFLANLYSGETDYYLYWNKLPLPCPHYKSNSFIGDPMDADVLGHDIQLWNDKFLLGIKGPSRGIDPEKNQFENWGMGSIILFYYNRKPIINIHSSWTWYFPSNSIASRPGNHGKNWSLPEILFKGPIRVSSITFLKDYQYGANKIDVYNKTYLYEKGNWVCFEQIIIPEEIPFNFSNLYNFAFEYDIKNDNIFYSKGNKILNFKTERNQLEDSKKGEIIFQDRNIDGWISIISENKPSYSIFIPFPNELKEAKTDYSFYIKNQVHFNFEIKLTDVKQIENFSFNFWFKGLKKEMKPDEILNIFEKLKSINIEIKDIEKLK